MWISEATDAQNDDMADWYIEEPTVIYIVLHLNQKK